MISDYAEVFKSYKMLIGMIVFGFILNFRLNDVDLRHFNACDAIFKKYYCPTNFIYKQTGRKFCFIYYPFIYGNTRGADKMKQEYIKLIVRFVIGILIGNGALLLLFWLISLIPQQKDDTMGLIILFCYALGGLLIVSFYNKMNENFQRIIRYSFPVHYWIYQWQER